MNQQAVTRQTEPPLPAEAATEPPSRVAPPIRPTAPGRRKRGYGPVAVALAIVVGLPTLLAVVYYGLIASPLYVTEASVTIRSSKQQSGSLLENLVVAQDAIAGSTETQLVADYFQSRDLLARIEADVGFRSRYATYNADYFTRMEPDAAKEEAHEYFKKMVEVIDDGAGLLTVTVRGFTPEDAVAVANSAIKAAEGMVNRLSDASQKDTIDNARNEIELAEARLLEASDAVMAYQKSSGDIDPSTTAATVLNVVAGLEGELASTRIKRAEMSSFLRAGSPAIRAVDSKIAALKRQIVVERERLAANNDETLADELRLFERKRLQLELAETAYKSALASLEAARLNVINDRSYLVAYAPPSLPDIAVEPRRMYKIATVFIVSLLAFGIGSLIVGAVREHARA